MDATDLIYETAVIFSHRDEDGTERVWNISSLEADPRVKRHTIRKFPIDLEYAIYAYRRMGIEKANLIHLWNKDINDPILMIEDNKNHIVIDGNHRYVIKAMKEEKWIYGKLLSKKIWKDHLIEGFTSQQMDRLVDQKSSFLITEQELYDGALIQT